MKNYFSFTRTQQIGLAVWMIVIVLIIFVSNFIRSHTSAELIHVHPDSISWLKINQQKSYQENGSSSSFYADENRIQYFNFDPNTIGINEWKKLGFSEKQSEAIINYKNKTGGFKSKSDLKKVYVISEEKYNQLEPYILLPDRVNEPEKIAAQKSINDATFEELEGLPLIGEKMAKRIIGFRNSLGGFYSLTQLHEVYGMTEQIYAVIVEEFSATPQVTKQLKINVANKDEIDKHPYIDFDAMAAILKYRETNKIKDLNFLIEQKLVTVEELEKIRPYIDFE